MSCLQITPQLALTVGSLYKSRSTTAPLRGVPKRKGKAFNRTVIDAKFSKDVLPTNNMPLLAEKLNGRLAMLGFLAGSGYEAVTGVNYLDQLKDTWVFAVLLVGVVTFGTLKTRNLEVVEKLPFTTNLELLNGRMAMLGLACKFIYDLNLIG
jgi:hypothetical protein